MRRGDRSENGRANARRSTAAQRRPASLLDVCRALGMSDDDIRAMASGAARRQLQEAAARDLTDDTYELLLMNGSIVTQRGASGEDAMRRYHERTGGQPVRFRKLQGG